MNGDASARTRREWGNAVLAVLGGVAVGVILVLLAWLVVLMTKDDPASRAAGTPPSAPAARATAAPTATRTVTVTPSVQGTSTSEPAAGDVRELPAGLFCRDLKARGFGYAAAVDYWRLHGQPGRMDADSNGIPCETVYSRGSVAAYWNGRAVDGVVYWSAGLYCRDLAARGASYAEAVRYWWYYGMPARMDADKNGIPCETVYSKAAVNAFWYP
ncbi:excalibur calcium-binding domain-containing protein [Kribbella sp. NPDC004875]|uniref:excalibur calcium-binding domain-containing protein n=1 Tax=Kribbella sp. NPDC004875 TaxID=3364107 RepID=UPI00369DA002